MLFSAINTSRFLLDNLRSLCPIFFIYAIPFTFLIIFDTYLVGTEGQKGM